MTLKRMFRLLAALLVAGSAALAPAQEVELSLLQ